MASSRLLLPVFAFALSACASSTIPAFDVWGPQSRPLAGSVVLRIAIPSEHGKDGHYISQATRSIAIEVRGHGFQRTFNADLTPSTNRHCNAARVCTITLPLPPGHYLASFATYDGQLSGGNRFTNPPTGRELSADRDVLMNVQRGRATVLKIVLGGIPSRALVLSKAGGGFALSKCVKQVGVSVFGLDADGNIILGRGAPRVSLVSSDSALLAVVQRPTKRSPNTFVLASPHLPDADAKVVLTASATPAKATGLSTTASVKQTVTFNADICGQFMHYTIPTANSVPSLGIISGPDGAIWFTEYVGNNIGRITTAGHFTEYGAGAPDSEPADLTLDSLGALWFSARGTNHLVKMTTYGQVTPYPVSVYDSGVFGITVDDQNNIWFTAQNSSTVGNIANTGTGGASIGTLTANANPIDIAFGPDHNYWSTEFDGNRIMRVHEFPITRTEYDIPTNNSGPFAIVSGPDGALWFTECLASKIGRITTAGDVTEFPIPTAGAHPRGITVGPDGALWFAEAGKNKIARVTTNGTIKEFAITGTSGAQPYGITTGPDRNLWFTEPGSNQIGRLQ